MSGVSEDLIDRLGAAALDAREAVREAHAATKDLHRVRAEVVAEIRGLVAAEWEERVKDAIHDNLTDLSATIKRAQDNKVQQIMDGFKVVSNLILYGKQSKKGLFICPEESPFYEAFRELERQMNAPVEVEGG